MRLIVDLTHPAHLHLFRHAIATWRERGDAVLVTARDKDVLTALLGGYRIGYETISHKGKGLLGLSFELLRRDYALWQRARAFRPDFLIGTSPAAAHVSRLIRGASVFFCEDDRKAVALQSLVSYPFSDWVVTPDAMTECYGPKHVKHNSYHELAYLHPARFSPNRSITRPLNLSQDERIFVLRFVSLGASHDRGEQGLSLKIKMDLLSLLSAHGRVLITSEVPLESPFDRHRIALPPDKLHDLLAAADMVISDSQTVTAEAAVLGIPNIRCNTFVGRLSYLEELEHKYGLTRGFRPDATEDMMALLRQWLDDPTVRETFSKRRETMLEDKCDFSEWMVNFIDKLHGKASKGKGGSFE